MRESYALNHLAGGNAAGETHPTSDATHNDASINPGIVFWETTDTATSKQAEAIDKNVLRETGRYTNNVAYRMTSGNPYKIYRLSGKATPKAILKSPQDANEHTNFGSNPSHEAFLHVGHMSKDGGTTGKIRFDIKIEYFVELSDQTGAENEN